MTHVSKHTLDARTEKRIVDAFMRALFSSSLERNKARVRAILTPTERIMLAKRLAIVTMLEQEQTDYDIMKGLNVSISTIRRLDRKRRAGHFDPLLRIFNRHLAFLDYLDLFLAAGMPSVAGPRHQKRLDALRSGLKPRN